MEWTANDRAAQSASGRTCLLVLGMHRSGTSALTAVLSIGGAALPHSLLGPRRGNEGGHWEPERLVLYHDLLLKELSSNWYDWRPLEIAGLSSDRRRRVTQEIGELLTAEFGNASLFIVKDPRICRFTGLFIDSLENAGIDARAVHVIRHPLEVADSLMKRDQFTQADGALQWLRHVLDSEGETRGRPRVFLSYETLLDDWRVTLERISESLDVAWPNATEDIEKQIAQFLSPGQRHHARTSDDVESDPALRSWIGETYSALLKLEQDPHSQDAMSALDTVRREFNRAAPILFRLQSELAPERKPQKPRKRQWERVTRRFGLRN